MIGGEQGDIFEGQPAAAQGGHGLVGAGQSGHGGFAEGDEHAWLDDGDLLAQVRKAALHFKGCRRTVARGAGFHVGAAFEHIGDVDVAA